MKNIIIEYEKQHKIFYDYYLNCSAIYFYQIIITTSNPVYKTWYGMLRVDNFVRNYFLEFWEMLQPISGVRYFRRFT